MPSLIPRVPLPREGGGTRGIQAGVLVEVGDESVLRCTGKDCHTRLTHTLG